MKIEIQLQSFFYSIFSGWLFYILSYFNYKIVKKYSVVWKYIITTIFVLDFDLLFVLGLYIINEGNLHVYFLLTLIITFFVSVKLMPKLKNVIKHLIKKWYNKNNRRL